MGYSALENLTLKLLSVLKGDVFMKKWCMYVFLWAFVPFFFLIYALIRSICMKKMALVSFPLSSFIIHTFVDFKP